MTFPLDRWSRPDVGAQSSDLTGLSAAYFAAPRVQRNAEASVVAGVSDYDLRDALRLMIVNGVYTTFTGRASTGSFAAKVGVNAHILNGTSNQATAIAAAAGLGVRWLRNGPTWTQVNPRQGNNTGTRNATTAAAVQSLIDAAAAASPSMRLVMPMGTGLAGGGFPKQVLNVSGCRTGPDASVPTSASTTLAANQIAVASGGGLLNVKPGSYLNGFTGYTAGALYASQSLAVATGSTPSPFHYGSYDIVTLTGNLPSISQGLTGRTITFGSTTQSYADDMAWLASQVTPGQVWEVMNEPNNSTDGTNLNTDATTYADLVNKCAQTVHGVDPSATVLAGPLTRFISGGANTYAAGMISGGLGNYHDGWAWHTYDNLGSYAGFDPGVAFATVMPAFLSTIGGQPGGGEQWITEFGWETVGGSQITTQAEQALFITEWLTECFAAYPSITTMLIYQLFDDVNFNGLMSAAGVPKQSYGAVSALLA